MENKESEAAGTRIRQSCQSRHMLKVQQLLHDRCMVPLRCAGYACAFWLCGAIALYHTICSSPDWIMGDICWLVVDKDGWDLNRSRSNVETGVIKWDWFQPSCKEKLIKPPQLNYIHYVAELWTFTTVYIKSPRLYRNWDVWHFRNFYVPSITVCLLQI